MAEIVSGPMAGTAMTPPYVEAVGRFAYIWEWPMVSMLNRRTGLTSVPEPGLRGGVLPNAPVGGVCMMTDYISPLDQFDGTVKEYDWANVPSFPVPGAVADGEIKWVDPDLFFDQLPEVLDTVPPLPGEEALYQQFRALLEAAAADPTLKEALRTAALETERDVITPLLRWEHNGPAAGNGWYSPKNNSAFGTDYLTRTAIARSNMFENTPIETKYIFTDADVNGDQLTGTNGYTVTFAAGRLPPVHGFYSMTLYNKHHFYFENDLGRYSLGTKNPGLVYGDDGSLTFYVGNTQPEGAPHSNWLPAPADDFSVYIRAYWPEEAILDATWQPPQVQPI